MSLQSAINEAQSAAAHAKPFLKLMDTLSNLDREVRAANSLINDAANAAHKKAQLEAEIPALQSRRDALTSEVASLTGNIQQQQAHMDERLAATVKAADDEIKRNQAAISADWERKIADKKSEIASMQSAIDELVKTKGEIQAQIDTLKESFKTAHAALA